MQGPGGGYAEEKRTSLPAGSLGPLAPTTKDAPPKRSNSRGSRILGGEPQPRREAALRVDHVALPIVVTIPRADMEQLTIGQRALFVVEVSGFGVMSTASYPFEKFEELYAAVTKVTRFALPPMPQSQWFGNAKQDVVEDRRGRLESLLQKMLMLQEVVDDADEQLWRFLQLPKPAVVAARFLSCDPKNRRLWLQRLWETSAEAKGHLPLQHPLVEKQLVTLCKNAITSSSRMDGEASREMAAVDERVARMLAEEASDAFLQASIACELLARIFGRAGETGRPASLGAEPQRHEWIEVLLVCCRVDAPAECPLPRSSSEKEIEHCQSDGSPRANETIVMAPTRPLRETAMKALRTLARTDRESWSQTMSTFLDLGGLVHLASTAAADSGEGEGQSGSGRYPLQRLVTELILRGFEDCVVHKLSASDVNKERRQLLNALFLSGDTFVRIMVGLLMAGLLCEDGFEDARQMNLGLQDILEDLRTKAQKPNQLAQDIDICLLLLENDVWKWLSSLVAAPLARVNTFVLLVISHIVGPSPSNVFETAGLHDRLLRLTEPEADPESRFYASKILLSAYRGGDRPSPAQPVLAHLCSCLAINFQAKMEHDFEHQDILDAEVSKSKTWAESTASLEQLMHQAREDDNHLRNEANEWRMSVSAAEESAEISQKCQAQVRNALQEHNTCLEMATTAIGDGSPSEEEANVMAELHSAEAMLAERERFFQDSELSVQTLAEERMEYTKSLSEHDEVARQLEDGISEAEESARQTASPTPHPGLAPYLSECRSRHAETLENITKMRAQAGVLDDQLCEMCEPLPRFRDEVKQDRQIVEELRARHAALSQSSTAIETWAGLLDRQRDCGEDIDRVQQSLRGVRGCVISERQRRVDLRASIHSLVASLTNLDDHLASLESWDNLEGGAGEGAFSPWAAPEH